MTPDGIDVSDDHLQAFREDLPAWFDIHQRDLPWREVDENGRRDPYRVWLAEVMLQQTRVDQARPYFERFVASFPTIESLAEADLDGVLREWEGLGYYARARNLHRAVREVVEHYDARVPDDAAVFGELPGVGPYTRAAVQSLAFGAPLAVLDGNVIRVLSRVFVMGDDVRRSAVRRRLSDLAQELIDPTSPGQWNEAIMELGATVCTRTGPRCEDCPLADVCRARAAGVQTQYPVARKKAPVPHYDIAVAVIFDELGQVLIQQRPIDAMLGGLWEFPGGKVQKGEQPEAACAREALEELGLEIEVGSRISSIRHAYSHFKITLHAFEATIRRGTPVHHLDQPLAWVAPDDLGRYAFPRANRRLIDTLLTGQAAH